MSLHKEVIRHEINGKIDASIFYAKQSFIKSKTNEDIKEGFKQAVRTIQYYKDVKVDPEFMSYAVRYHDTLERNLKNTQNFDKKLNRISTGRLIVFSQLAKMLE